MKSKIISVSLVVLFCLSCNKSKPSGNFDPSFGSGTGANGIINAMVIQSDGKIIVAGNFTTFNGVSRENIARLNSDGSLDESFNPAAAATDDILEVLIQQDGKIIIADYTKGIVRMNTDGSLDTDFNLGGSGPLYSTIDALALQVDGKIVIGGAFYQYNDVTRNHIARLNSDGTLDTSFDPGTGFSWGAPSVKAIKIQDDGKILVGGLFSDFNGVDINDNLIRLNTDGSIDPAFVLAGSIPWVFDIEILHNKITDSPAPYQNVN